MPEQYNREKIELFQRKIQELVDKINNNTISNNERQSSKNLIGTYYVYLQSIGIKYGQVGFDVSQNNSGFGAFAQNYLKFSIKDAIEKKTLNPMNDDAINNFKIDFMIKLALKDSELRLQTVDGNISYQAIANNHYDLLKTFGLDRNAWGGSYFEEFCGSGSWMDFGGYDTTIDVNNFDCAIPMISLMLETSLLELQPELRPVIKISTAIKRIGNGLQWLNRLLDLPEYGDGLLEQKRNEVSSYIALKRLIKTSILSPINFVTSISDRVSGFSNKRSPQETLNLFLVTNLLSDYRDNFQQYIDNKTPITFEIFKQIITANAQDQDMLDLVLSAINQENFKKYYDLIVYEPLLINTLLLYKMDCLAEVNPNNNCKAELQAMQILANDDLVSIRVLGDKIKTYNFRVIDQERLGKKCNHLNVANANDLQFFDKDEKKITGTKRSIVGYNFSSGFFNQNLFAYNLDVYVRRGAIFLPFDHVNDKEIPHNSQFKFQSNKIINGFFPNIDNYYSRTIREDGKLIVQPNYGVDFDHQAIVKPIGNGDIIFTGWDDNFGNVVMIRHELNGLVLISSYSYLEKINVKVGDIVNIETDIGRAGSTGLFCKKPCLHLELRSIDGVSVVSANHAEEFLKKNLSLFFSPKTAIDPVSYMDKDIPITYNFDKIEGAQRISNSHNQVKSEYPYTYFNNDMLLIEGSLFSGTPSIMMDENFGQRRGLWKFVFGDRQYFLQVKFNPDSSGDIFIYNASDANKDKIEDYILIDGLPGHILYSCVYNYNNNYSMKCLGVDFINSNYNFFNYNNPRYNGNFIPVGSSSLSFHYAQSFAENPFTGYSRFLHLSDGSQLLISSREKDFITGLFLESFDKDFNKNGEARFSLIDYGNYQANYKDGEVYFSQDKSISGFNSQITETKNGKMITPYSNSTIYGYENSDTHYKKTAFTVCGDNILFIGCSAGEYSLEALNADTLKNKYISNILLLKNDTERFLVDNKLSSIRSKDNIEYSFLNSNKMLNSNFVANENKTELPMMLSKAYQAKEIIDLPNSSNFLSCNPNQENIIKISSQAKEINIANFCKSPSNNDKIDLSNFVFSSGKLRFLEATNSNSSIYLAPTQFYSDTIISFSDFPDTIIILNDFDAKNLKPENFIFNNQLGNVNLQGLNITNNQSNLTFNQIDANISLPNFQINSIYPSYNPSKIKVELSIVDKDNNIIKDENIILIQTGISKSGIESTFKNGLWSAEGSISEVNDLLQGNKIEIGKNFTDPNKNIDSIFKLSMNISDFSSLKHRALTFDKQEIAINYQCLELPKDIVAIIDSQKGEVDKKIIMDFVRYFNNPEDKKFEAVIAELQQIGGINPLIIEKINKTAFSIIGDKYGDYPLKLSLTGKCQEVLDRQFDLSLNQIDKDNVKNQANDNSSTAMIAGLASAGALLLICGGLYCRYRKKNSNNKIEEVPKSQIELSKITNIGQNNINIMRL